MGSISTKRGDAPFSVKAVSFARRLKVSATDENVRILQFLDLIRDVDVYSEEGDDLKKRVLEIMQKMDITFSALEPYSGYFLPDAG